MVLGEHGSLARKRDSARAAHRPDRSRIGLPSGINGDRRCLWISGGGSANLGVAREGERDGRKSVLREGVLVHHVLKAVRLGLASSIISDQERGQEILRGEGEYTALAGMKMRLVD